MTTGEMDGEWFRKQLARVGKSQNALGTHLGIPGSQASRTFSGQRKMKFDEVPKIARFLGVSVEDVLLHAGLEVNPRVAKPMMAEQFVGADGRVTPTEPVELPAELVSRAREAVPFDRQQHVNAALIRAPKGALAIWDDALVLYEDLGSAPPEMGVLSIARLRDGVVMMGKVQSVKKTGEGVIETADGQTKTVQIEATSKVLAVIP